LAKGLETVREKFAGWGTEGERTRQYGAVLRRNNKKTEKVRGRGRRGFLTHKILGHEGSLRTRYEVTCPVATNWRERSPEIDGERGLKMD